MSELQALTPPSRSILPTRQTLRGLAIVDGLIGTGCVAGAIGLVGGGLEPPMHYLDESVFDSYIIPGLILGFIVGGSSLVAGWLAARGSMSARYATMLAAGILFGWMAIEVAIIGLESWMQPATMFLALGQLTLAWRSPGWFPRNVGFADGMVRLVIAFLAAVLAGMLGFGTVLGILLMVVTGILAGSAATGSCPIYAMTGVDTTSDSRFIE